MKYPDLIVLLSWTLSHSAMYLGMTLPICKRLPKASRYPRFFRFLSFAPLLYAVAVFSPITHFEVVVLTFALLLQSLFTLEWATPETTSTIPGVKIISWLLQGATVMVLMYWSAFNPVALMFSTVLILGMIRPKPFLDSLISLIIWVVFISYRFIA